MQLELSFYAPTSVRGCLSDYITMKGETVTEETIRDDYMTRAAWCAEQFGELTPVASVTFAAMERAARSARSAFANVTIKRRLVFFCAAVKYAEKRGIVPRGTAPDLPPWLRDDSQRCEDYYTPEQFAAYEAAMGPGLFRINQRLGFWTGQHTLDLFAMRRSMLDTEYRWEDETGAEVRRGRWLRHNHKNRRCEPTWLPMEPELLVLALEVLNEPGSSDDLITGRIWNIKRACDKAADRAELPRIRANLGLRASHATMLMSRGYSYEYVRQVLGHEGEMRQAGASATPRASRPTMLSRHYLRSSPALFSAELSRRR